MTSTFPDCDNRKKAKFDQKIITERTYNRQSIRVQSQKSLPSFDSSAKKRRIQRQLEKLEQDNFHDDPHGLHGNPVSLKISMPKFDDAPISSTAVTKSRTKRGIGNDPITAKLTEHATKRGKKLVAGLTKTRFRKTFVQMIEEDEQRIREVEPEARTYRDVVARSSPIPARKFCPVCGLFSKYTCIQCRSHFCSLKCREVHKDTRCLKWTT